MSRSAVDRPPLHALTGLRFLAALYVVAFHQRFGLVTRPGALHNVVDHGYVAVPLFFILSGFVLTYVYVDAGGDFRATHRSFYLARLARIYPVYLLAFVLCTPIVLREAPPRTVLAPALSALSLTQSWTPFDAWNRPSWSLSTEAFFYLAFPFVAVPLCRLRRRGLVIAALALWLLGVIPVLAYYALGLSDQWLEVVKHNPVLRLPEFLIGVAVGKLFLDRRAAGRAAGAWRDGLCVLIALVGIAAAVSFSSSTRAEEEGVLLHNGALDPLCGLLIYGLAGGRGIVARVLSLRAMTLLGEASYGIYILQAPIADFCKAAVALLVAGRVQADVPLLETPTFVVGYAVLLIGCALVSLRWVETPARKAITRRWGRTARSLPPQAPTWASRR